MEIILAALGSTGLFSLVQYLLARYDSKNDKIFALQRKLEEINARCANNELATCRFQLLWLLEAHSENKSTILETARRYFITLHGDGEAWSQFHSWAETNHIDVSWYQSLLQQESKKERNDGSVA